MEKKKSLRYIVSGIRIFVGIVFMVSGFLKAVDPYGTAIKLTEYFTAFGMDFLEPVTLFLSVVLICCEFLCGFFLTMGLWYKKIVIWIITALVGFFTILTLFIALTNPVSDCGCFGDAIKLTNWQTFFKNIVLAIFVVVLVVTRNVYSGFFARKQKIPLVFLAVLFIGYIVFNSVYYLPLIDFRPFKIGSDIKKAMSIPVNAPADEFETQFYYKKNGETKVFNESNYPWQDSTWQFVEMKSVLTKQGYVPAIHNFVLEKAGEGDIVSMVLSEPDPVFLWVAPEYSENLKGMAQIKRLNVYCAEHGLKFYFVTSSPVAVVSKSQLSDLAPMQVLYSDKTALKTALRASSGLIILQKGVVIGKYNWRNVPLDFGENVLSYQMIAESREKYQLKLLILSLILAIGILAIKNCFKEK